jgi:hypothetical protein
MVVSQLAMIEDICWYNLAPFMLVTPGDSPWNSNTSWCNAKSLRQHAAASLLDWLATELALLGINVQVRTRFDNRIGIFLSDHAQAEKVMLDNIITKLDNKLITREEALRDLARL